jgi:hypothetical protein
VDQPAVTAGTKQDVVLPSEKAGAVCGRAGHRSVPGRDRSYDELNINMTVVDVRTGKTSVNPDKLFKKDGDTISAATQHARPVANRLSPRQELALRSVPRPIIDDGSGPFHAAGFGRRTGVPSGCDRRRIGMAGSTSPQVVTSDLPQPRTNGSALTTAGDVVFFGDLCACARSMPTAEGPGEAVVGSDHQQHDLLCRQQQRA